MTPKSFTGFFSRALAVDSSDLPHIAYGGDHLYYTYYDGANWNYETVDRSPGTGRYASIALDSSSKVHISYYDDTNNDLKYVTNTTGSWVTETVNSNVDVFSNTSIALDSSGKVHIGYSVITINNFTISGNLKYTTNATGFWVTETVDSSRGLGMSIALDTSDKVHISYTIACTT